MVVTGSATAAAAFGVAVAGADVCGFCNLFATFLRRIVYNMNTRT